MILHNGIFQSELLSAVPVVHGFTTRQWGSLGYGRNPGDPEVTENRRRLFQELGFEQRRLVQPKQVHSATAVDEREFAAGCEADATYGRAADALHSILTADCVPILVYHPDGAVAAIHAGWRGLAAGIIPATLRHLPPGSLAVVGPGIGACCYEVSEELANEFERKFGTAVVDRSFLKPHLDLNLVALQQLDAAGVEECEAAYLCTSCHSDLFYSYRRDGSSGRQMAFIGLR